MARDVTLADHAALAHAPRAQPRIPWWDLPAKVAAGERIADEEKRAAILAARPAKPANNEFDALRHARWSQRTAQEAGPVFALGAGLAHEADNLADTVVGNIDKTLYPERIAPRQVVPTVGQTLAESAMDMHNNLEGVRAAVGGRPIDRSALQMWPR